MKATYALTIAATKMLTRNKPSLIFSFIIPLLILLVVGFLPQNSAPKIGVGITGPADSRIVAELRASKALVLKEGTPASLQADLAAGKLALVVHLPAPSDAAGTPVRTFSNGAQPVAAEIARALVLRQIERTHAEPAGVHVIDQRVATRELRYVDFLLPGLIGLGIMQMCIYSVAPVFVFYRERGILKRLLSTPMQPYQFIVANSVARLLVACTQAAALLAVGAWVFGASPTGSYLALALTVVLGTVMFLGLGFSVAGLASSVEAAPALANLATFPMIFLGGTFFSVSSLPRWSQDIAAHLPLAHFSGALRAIINEGAGLPQVVDHMFGLTLWSLLFIALALSTFRLRFARPA